jgi:hypothetical protein
MRIYRFRDLRGAGVPFTRKHVRTLEQLDQFPRHVNFGVSTVAWLADEVDEWVATAVRDRRQMPRRGSPIAGAVLANMRWHPKAAAPAESLNPAMI